MPIKITFSVAFLAHFLRCPYLCIVFFIVLDLRLQRLGQSVDPFFMSIHEAHPVNYPFVTHFFSSLYNLSLGRTFEGTLMEICSPL